MTGIDRDEAHSGYWRSPWAVECGGNRRQKTTSAPLDAANRDATVITSANGRWNVMVVRRDPGEWFLSGTMAAFHGDPPFGWVQRIDPDTLMPTAETLPLPCGDHVWCGSLAIHANGSLYNVNGSYLHRISPDCEVLAESRLAVDQAHNGLLILSDGTIVTKDLRLGGDGGSTLTRVDPTTLEPVHAPLVLPEGSMGRIAADLTPEGEFIYVPGTNHVFRIRVDADQLVVDEDWRPLYRSDESQGLAWDSCLSGGYGWLMDNGDIPSVRRLFDQHPNGRFPAAPGRTISWRLPAPWPGPQRLLRVDLESGQVAEVAPFDSVGGGIIAPPIHLPDHGLVVCWDSINGGLAGLDDITLETRWISAIRATMQPLAFAATGELVINDCSDGPDRLVVIDAATGDTIDRVDVGSSVANGMFLTPGDDHDVWYCSTLTFARVHWAA